MATASKSTRRRPRQGAATMVRQRSRCTSKTYCVVALAVLVMPPHQWKIVPTSPQESYASPDLLRQTPGVMHSNFIGASMGCHDVRESHKAVAYFAHASPIIHQRMLQAPTISPAPSVSILSSTPSTEPSNPPTIDLSASPSEGATTIPSLIPSTVPSVSPSENPTSNPTDLPSESPSLAPTISTSPTLTPSYSPSDSLSPSTNPTNGPSASPSNQPTSNPTSSPSASPSNEPTSSPSSNPSTTPSASPSAHPSNLPSVSPSTEPTSTPSSPPSKYPTSTPSMVPSSSPSSTPSNAPTSSPSSSPSVSPTVMPTMVPSSTPSSAPSTSPTSRPSSFPSVDPTAMPSLMPSASPSSTPSASPSSSPNSSPSAKPTTTPSLLPSASPSSAPSASPSSTPTVKPSASPTDQPTSNPSSSPSKSPTWQPSTSPSNQPTGTPSAPPSVQPTGQPSASPSHRPTNEPSASPSATPSFVPSIEPTDAPSISSSPTMKPSMLPTVIVPSASPSAKPSTSPSSSPSQYPTNLPSVTISPTNALKESAVLDFMLPFDTLLDSKSIATFEETLEEFLHDELSKSSEGTKVKYFNVTVVSQRVVASDEEFSDEELSNAEPEPVRRAEPEPVRRRSLEEMSLLVSVLIDAILSPISPTTEIDFQREVTKAVTQDSARFFGELFGTEAFEGFDPTDEPEESKSPLKPADGNNTVAIATTAACGVVLGSIALLFFVIRRRRVAESAYIVQKDVVPPSDVGVGSPPLDYANYDDDDVVSSLADDEMIADAERDSKVEIDNDADKWSLDDAFPLQRSEGLGMPHSQLTDSDDDATGDEEWKRAAAFATTDENACENNDTPSSRVLNSFEEMHPVNDEVFVESTKPQSDPQPKSMLKSVLNFSCFADNTFKEQEKETHVKRSSFSSNSRLYEVRVPPGPLGIIVDNSPSGGTVIAEVKATSPLKHMVSVGDKIVMLDDVDTSKKSAVALGQWIAKKPYKEEQVLIVMAKEECGVNTCNDMEDMSV